MSSLTRREEQVVRRLARGMTNAEIASDLGAAEKTVKNHLHTVAIKTQLDNRVKIAVWWVTGRNEP